MEKEHREDFALAPAMEPAGNNGDREPRRRRQQRAASQSESREADDQRLALHDRMLAAMQAGDVRSLLADGPSSATQMNKEEFLAQLRLAVEAAANQELGRLGSAAGCPYIESYFGKYGQQPAAAAELLLRRWVPNATGAASARDLIPLVVARVRTGVHEWTKTGALPADLSAADPQVAALAPVAQAAQVQSTQAAVGNEAAAPTSLHAMEAELGSGQALDGATAARVGAGGAAGDVKIHTGPVAAAKAAQHNAVAFAVGNNVVMGAGAPAPGTLLGDALLAHELAHTAQQRDAARDPQARKRAIGGEDVAAEHDADRAAAQGLATAGKDPALAGLAAVGDRFGDVMKTGLQLQRCSEQQAQTKGSPSELAKQYGLTLTTSPNVDEGSNPAVVGGRVTFVLNANLAKMQAAGRKVSVNGWDLAGPDGGHFATSFVDKPETTLPIVKPGRHVFTATIRVDDNLEIPLSTSFSAVTAGDRAQTLLADEHAPQLGDYKSSLLFTQALLAPASAAEQGAPDFRIETSSENPALLSDDKSVTYSLIDRFADGVNRRWFARPLSWDGMPDKLGEHARANMADGLPAYDLGHGSVATLPTSHKGTFAVVCQTLDAQGNTLHDARYLQAVLTKGEAKSAKELGTFIERVERMDDRFDGDAVPVSATHVATMTSSAMPLRLYLGKKKNESNTWLLLDLTAGVDPERNQLAYTGSSVGAVLAEFKDHNKYPTGAIAWRIDGLNKLGVAAREERFDTDGESTLEKLSSWSGIASLALMGAAIVAAPFSAGGSLLVTSFIVGSAAFGVAAGALSLADHLQNEKVSATSVAIDSAQIVASMLNAGAALKAARSGAAMMVASRGGRFLLWSAFTADSVSALLITAEGITQISAIVDNDNLPADAKASAILRVVTNLVLTGALIALSYGDLRATQGRLTKHIGPSAGALTQTDQLTLGLIEDATLAHLKGATTPDLERLVSMVKGDPPSIARLVGQPGLLPALKRTTGATMRHLELELLRDRLTKLGLPEPLVQRVQGALSATDISGAQLHVIDDASLQKVQVIDTDLAAGKLREAREAFATIQVPGTARRELEIAMAKAHGLPDLGSHTIVDVALAKKLFASLEARGIDIAVFRAHPMDDLVAKKVNTALTGDPLMPSKSTPEIDAARVRAEQWALAGANGNPSEFANRYEYARAKFGNAKEQHAPIAKAQKPKDMTADLYAKDLAARELDGQGLDASLKRDVATIQNLPPGQNRVERLPTDTPESIAPKVQQLDRIAYQSASAEAYHVEKHARELKDIVGLPEHDQVARFAEATRLTLREGMVHALSLESNGSFKLVIRREFSSRKKDTVMLEAIVYVQPDGKVVIATFGASKAKETK